MESHFQKLNASAEQWVPEVRRLRPGLPWEGMLRVVNSGLSRGAQPWSLPRLIRAAKSFVRDGLLPDTILARATASDKDDRLRRGASIALACRTFGVSETCYRYGPKFKAENEEIADLLVGLTDARKTCGFGLCFLHLRNVKGHPWNHMA